MPQIYVAAGGNVEPERYLQRALSELARVFGPLTCSSWYRNRAVGFEGADFINLAVAFASEREVHSVVEELHRIEFVCDRPRGAPKWAPRTMDLDLLLHGDLICQELKLVLPRPDLLKRAYMLGPLAEIAPDTVHPTAQLSIGELWARFDRAAHPLEAVRAGTKSVALTRDPSAADS